MKYKKRRARLEARIERYKKLMGTTPISVTGASFSRTLKEMKKPGSFNK